MILCNFYKIFWTFKILLPLATFRKDKVYLFERDFFILRKNICKQLLWNRKTWLQQTDDIALDLREWFDIGV